MPSAQLHTYLTARASGSTVDAAANLAGFSLTEARLTEKAIEAGDIELPQPSTEEESMANDNTSNPTGERLRLFIERVERLEEEKKGIGDDISDVLTEAKNDGFDTKTIKRIIKLRKMKPEERQEAQALLSTYMDAIGMTPIEEAIALAAAA